MIKVCAVVVTYNRRELLRKCVDALLAQTYSLEQIVIIDNNSDDGTEAVVDGLCKTSYIKLPINLGGSYGFYKGVQISSVGHYDYIWVMDDDSIPEPDALEHLMEHASEYPVLCPSVVALDGNFDLTHRRRVDLVKTSESVVELKEYREKIVEIDLFSFVGTLFETRLIAEVGLPRDDLFFQYDDTEFSLRIRKNNIKIGMVPNSRILHIGSASYPAPLPKYNNRRHFYSIRNRTYIYSIYSKSKTLFILSTGLEFIKTIIRLRKKRELGWETLRVTLLAYAKGLRGDLSGL